MSEIIIGELQEKKTVAKNEQRYRNSFEESAQNQRLLLALSQAAQSMQRARTPKEVYVMLGEQLVKLGYHAVVLSLSGNRSNLEVTHVTFDREQIGKIETLLGTSLEGYFFLIRSEGFYDRVIRGGRTLFTEGNLQPVSEALPEGKGALTEQFRALLGLGKAIFTPLVGEQAPQGLLMVTGEDLKESDKPGVTAFAHQVAIAIENAYLLQQVRAGRERLHRLAKRIVTTQEDERRRLSRELHDEAGQALTALKIDLELIKSDIAKDATELQERLSNAIDLIDVTMERLRSLAQGLRPPALDMAGLNVTLEDYCQDFASRTFIEVTYEGTELPELIDVTKITLYRFLQEALTNVARHARASRVWVRMQKSEGAASLSVEDNGVGVDAQSLMSDLKQGQHIGLLGLRERLEMVGGWLEIDSQPGEGTRLAANVPLKRDYLERRRLR
jgi:signal transduction histidine kinase